MAPGAITLPGGTPLPPDVRPVRIGECNFGVVRKVSYWPGAPFSKKEHPTVAMKIVKKPDDDAWNEVELLKTFDHPHIVKYLTSYKSSEGDLKIIMEYCDGGTFTQILKTYRKAEWNIWRTIRDIADALSFLHRRHILHRHIKPDNILAKFAGVDPDDGARMYDLKICDFGVAKLLNKKAQDIYYASTVIGTPIYMAPEILKDADGRTRYTTSADIWALGALVAFHGDHGKHLFPTQWAVFCWNKGGYNAEYSQDFLQLVNAMLDPQANSRPTAAWILQETRKGRRTDEPKKK